MTIGTSASRILPTAASLEDELTHLQKQIKASPGDLALRTYLFQMLCVFGHWERALQQLNVCATLGVKTKPMVDAYRAAIVAERHRQDVFAGKRAPAYPEAPPEWLDMMAAALRADAAGDSGRALELRTTALETAEEQPGTLDGSPIAWIADADSRLGPVCEIIVNDSYCWLPYAALRHLRIAPPRDLRDLIWASASATLRNGRELAVLIPVRYPGTESLADEFRLAKKTTWQEAHCGCWQGHGQRIWVSDSAEHPLLDIRQLDFDLPGAA